MLDEDVFDSVTWETPAANGYEVETPRLSSGPGYRQSTAGAEGGGLNEPKWEGYLMTSVRDPLKELPDTKDAYVSYLVTAEVRLPFDLEDSVVLNVYRRTCQHLPLIIARLADAFRTLFFSETTSQKTSQLVLCLLCPTSIAWVWLISEFPQTDTQYVNHRIPHWRPVQRWIHGTKTSRVSLWHVPFILFYLPDSDSLVSWNAYRDTLRYSARHSCARSSNQKNGYGYPLVRFNILHYFFLDCQDAPAPLSSTRTRASTLPPWQRLWRATQRIYPRTQTRRTIPRHARRCGQVWGRAH